MSGWTAAELDAVGRAEELELAPRRPNGELRRATTMWVVRVGDELYVRSAYGPEAGWYRHALASGTGHIRAGGVGCDVTFSTASADDHAAIDAAYHAKYDRYGAKIVDTVVGAHRYGVTVRLLHGRSA